MRETSLVERFDYYAKLMRSQLTLERRQVKPGRLLRCIPNGWKVVALDERGEQVTSEELAGLVRRWMRSGVTGTAFLIGAADGLPPEARRRADTLLALSRLTLPHQLCMVLLAEQLYRATAIIAGAPYHRS